MTISARAPGKLILLGEYAVLEGAPAIVIAVNRCARVDLSATGEGFRVLAPDVGVDCAEGKLGRGLVFEWISGASHRERVELGLVAACIEEVALALGERRLALPPAEVRIDSHELRVEDGGAKLGLGSSAAVAAATVSALMAHAGLNLSDAAVQDELFATTLAAHQAAQGKSGSGVDVAASVYGGLLRFARPRQGPPIASRLPDRPWLEPIAIWSGRSASTPSYVAQVRAFKDRTPQAYATIIEGLTVAAEAGLVAIGGDDVAGFARAVDSSGGLLEELGTAAGVDIFSAEHQKARSVVQAAGGVYKPSGSGGGDLGLAFATVPEGAADLRAAIVAAGLDVVPLTLALSGATLGKTP